MASRTCALWHRCVLSVQAPEARDLAPQAYRRRLPHMCRIGIWHSCPAVGANRQIAWVRRINGILPKHTDRTWLPHMCLTGTDCTPRHQRPEMMCTARCAQHDAAQHHVRRTPEKIGTEGGARVHIAVSSTRNFTRTQSSSVQMDVPNERNRSGRQTPGIRSTPTYT